MVPEHANGPVIEISNDELDTPGPATGLIRKRAGVVSLGFNCMRSSLTPRRKPYSTSSLLARPVLIR
jgi:hypothetical protein